MCRQPGNSKDLDKQKRRPIGRLFFAWVWRLADYLSDIRQHGIEELDRTLTYYPWPERLRGVNPNSGINRRCVPQRLLYSGTLYVNK